MSELSGYSDIIEDFNEYTVGMKLQLIEAIIKGEEFTFDERPVTIEVERP
jgi:uncharacterized coiled-coil DUF342 family protein